MGDRYYLYPKCPFCGHVEEEDYYYAPTGGFMTHECEKCHKIIDLEKHSGINAESTASSEYGIKSVKESKERLNKDELKELVKDKLKKIKYENRKN